MSKTIWGYDSSNNVNRHSWIIKGAFSLLNIALWIEIINWHLNIKHSGNSTFCSLVGYRLNVLKAEHHLRLLDEGWSQIFSLLKIQIETKWKSIWTCLLPSSWRFALTTRLISLWLIGKWMQLQNTCLLRNFVNWLNSMTCNKNVELFPACLITWSNALDRTAKQELDLANSIPAMFFPLQKSL